MRVISQIVDTLKLHYYHSDQSRQEDLEKYNIFLEDLRGSKAVAMDMQNENNDFRYIDRKFGVNEFRVMARSINGFSVVLKNQDVSIAFRRMNDIKTPFCKVEFRAEFLARKGYVQATKIVNQFIEEHIYQTAKIKVSEIHLATDIQGKTFNILDVYRFKTRARKKSIHTADDDQGQQSLYVYGRRFSGFVIGSGDYMLRVYDKSLEINTNKQKEFIKHLRWSSNPLYEENEVVWRIELQLRRNKLKKLVGDGSGILDGFENVLNAIPDLWQKAIDDFNLMDLSEDQVLQIINGYKKLKNGTEKPLTKYAYSKMYQRSDRQESWQKMSNWNNYIGNQLNTYINVPMHSKQYLNNALKGFLGQVAKNYGDINPKTIIDSFIDCEDMEMQSKKMGVIENVFEKQLDHFQKVEYQMLQNGVFIDSNLILKNNIEKYVNEASSFLYFNPTKHGIEKLNKKLVS